MQMTDGRSAYRQEGEQMSEQDEWAGEREQRLRMIRDSAASLVPRDGDLSRVRRDRF
ncbi:acyl-CoA dehydrogenase, partial [Pseudomonas aeruginosa]|nr:acyl-CoA dehydrogenase [Pseudomonas aeruginosa]